MSRWFYSYLLIDWSKKELPIANVILQTHLFIPRAFSVRVFSRFWRRQSRRVEYSGVLNGYFCNFDVWITPGISPGVDIPDSDLARNTQFSDVPDSQTSFRKPRDSLTCWPGVYQLLCSLLFMWCEWGSEWTWIVASARMLRKRTVCSVHSFNLS